MSTLTFFIRQGSELSPDELIQQQALRAMIASVLDVPIDRLTSGWTIGRTREFRCSVHAARIPRQWIERADALMRLELVPIGYEWTGEIEECEMGITVEMEHAGKKYKGVVYAVSEDEEIAHGTSSRHRL